MPTTSKNKSPSMTESGHVTFAFAAHFSRPVEAGFIGARMASEQGAIPLRAVDRKIGFFSPVGEPLSRSIESEVHCTASPAGDCFSEGL